VVVPVYNEEALLQTNLELIRDYLRSSEPEVKWEMIIVDDGSADTSWSIVQEFAAENPNVTALCHSRNLGVGQALRYGFANTSGDYVVTMDVDLSYDVSHIGRLARRIRDSGARLVLASPYTEGGKISNVPLVRRVLSVLGNRFLKVFVRGRLSTLTSMVRAYDGEFIRAVDLRALGMELMPEIVYKSMILRASIEEIPAELDWGPPLKFQHRTSSMRLLRHVISTVLSGFLFRPFLFFVVPGILMGVFAAYVAFWMVIHFFEAYSVLDSSGAPSGPSAALALAYQQYPHTYIVGLLSIMLSIQLSGLGILALQSKRYFEDLFHLGSTLLRKSGTREM